jgi:hypothetical protein
MTTVGITLFGAAWIACICAWFLSIAELVGIWRFWPRAYRSGIKVLDQPISKTLPGFSVSQIVELPAVKAKVMSAEEILFRVPFRWFGLMVHTPFPIKGSLVRLHTGPRVLGRIPVFTTAFVIAWLVGWTVGGVTVVLEISGMEAVKWALLGWVFAGAIVGLSLPLERRRIKKAADALVDYLNKAA